MFGFIKSIIFLAVLLGAVAAGFAYLPTDLSTSVGTQSAGLAVKGCRGAQAFIGAFTSQWQEKKGEEAAEPQPESRKRR